MESAHQALLLEGPAKEVQSIHLGLIVSKIGCNLVAQELVHLVKKGLLRLLKLLHRRLLIEQ